METQCPFGRWYHGSAVSRYGHCSEYAEIGTLHSEIHALAAEAHAFIEQGQQASAAQLIPQLAALHNQLTGHLDQLVAQAKAFAVPHEDMPYA
jgi:hypothetical protein